MDLKQKLIDGEVSLYRWTDTKSMTAYLLTKEGGEIENILEVVRQNTFKKENNQQNLVIYNDEEMMLMNLMIKKN